MLTYTVLAIDHGPYMGSAHQAAAAQIWRGKAKSPEDAIAQHHAQKSYHSVFCTSMTYQVWLGDTHRIGQQDPAPMQYHVTGSAATSYTLVRD